MQSPSSRRAMKSNSGEKRNQIDLYDHSSTLSMHSSKTQGSCVTHLNKREDCLKWGSSLNLDKITNSGVNDLHTTKQTGKYKD